MLFTCEADKREISLHKVIDEVNSGQGKNGRREITKYIGELVFYL